MVDENYGQTGARAEREPGPWGGIPGIFAQLASESHLNYDVHIEAISATSLRGNYAAASGVIDRAMWNVVVLQELSTRPLPYALTRDRSSDPRSFCAAVKAIERGVHAAAPSSRIYLYETWPRADLARRFSGRASAPEFAARYSANLSLLGASYRNVYHGAAEHDKAITGVIPVGDAWTRAWAEGVAEPNPYRPSTDLPVLWYGINSVNDPPIASPDYLHPSVYGAYLAGLVLFQEISGIDVRKFGAGESAATDLGIPSPVAAQLRQVAWKSVTDSTATPIDPSIDPL